MGSPHEKLKVEVREGASSLCLALCVGGGPHSGGVIEVLHELDLLWVTQATVFLQCHLFTLLLCHWPGSGSATPHAWLGSAAIPIAPSVYTNLLFFEIMCLYFLI